jgi:hypothetical protein
LLYFAAVRGGRRKHEDRRQRLANMLSKPAAVRPAMFAMVRDLHVTVNPYLPDAAERP